MKDFDYSQSGGYFITICTHKRASILARVLDSTSHLNSLGELVHRHWLQSANLRDELALDVFVVMPNHLHGIVFINRSDDSCLPSPMNSQSATTANELRQIPNRSSRSISSFLAGFKSAATSAARKQGLWHDGSLWQRNYYEHVIRNEKELHALREYIVNNPLKWELDEYYAH